METNKNLMGLLEFILILLKLKFYFHKPKKEKVLLYDRLSKPYAEILFNTKKFAIYDTRYESINIYVLFFTFIKNGLRNFKHNYKINYFNFVKPKLVYTMIDNNIGFYKLKNFFPKTFFIADQNGVRDEKFFNICRKPFKKKSRSKTFGGCFFLFLIK